MTDINECLLTGEGGHNCNTSAICTNTNGSFTCDCQPGFSGDGVDCDGKLKEMKETAHILVSTI